MRNVLVLLVAAIGTVALGQAPGRLATPLDAESLDRLKLRSDWNAYIPVSGKRDGLALIQPVDEQQVFVQTNAGLLVALDARTGRQQWSHRFPNSFVGSYPVAVNSKFCFAVSVGKLFAFNRFTGSLILEQDLREAFPHREETPLSGPVADSRNVFIQMASGWFVSYTMPSQLQSGPEASTVLADPKAKPGAPKSMVDQVAKNYGTYLNPPQSPTESSDYRVRPVETDRTAGTNRDQATPSISALHSVVPPYELNRNHPVPSLSALSTTIYPPYKLVPDHMKYNQPSPSVGSQSALYRLDEDSNLRAVGEKFKREWRYAVPQRGAAQPVVADNPADPFSSRIWLSTEGSTILALNKAKGTEEIVGKFAGQPLHAMVGPFAFSTELLGFIPLDTGVVLAIDLTSGFRSPDRKATPVVYHWKVPVGGQMNHAPVVGADSVYVSGSQNGAARIDIKTGELIWKTDFTQDRILAVNKEHVYIQDRRGRLVVFLKDGRPDARSHVLQPSASIDASAFTMGVSNSTTDRILMGADNGLVVCLRESSPAYAKPVRIAPPGVLPPPKKPDPKAVEQPMVEQPKN